MKSQTHKLHHLLPDERRVNYEMRQSKLYPYRNSFIGLYRENAIAIEGEARYPFGGNVY